MNEKCPCKKCLDATKRGIKSMEKEDADNFSKYDYVTDMTSDLWEECENCKDSNWEEE